MPWAANRQSFRGGENPARGGRAARLIFSPFHGVYTPTCFIISRKEVPSRHSARRNFLDARKIGRSLEKSVATEVFVQVLALSRARDRDQPRPARALRPTQAAPACRTSQLRSAECVGRVAGSSRASARKRGELRHIVVRRA